MSWNSKQYMLFGRNKLLIAVFVTCNRDARLVAFRKSGSLGIQVSGGNKSGIFVAAVKEGSPAYNEGLRKGDQILMVSNHSIYQCIVCCHCVTTIQIVWLFKCRIWSSWDSSQSLKKTFLMECLSPDWLKPVALFLSKWRIVCRRENSTQGYRKL